MAFSALLVVLLAAVVSGTRVADDVIRLPSSFQEAPAFRNGDECGSAGGRVDVAMTLDANYLRGTVAAVFSILQHTARPEDVAFHFLAAPDEADDDPAVYRFDPSRVRGRISRSVRRALDQPLNYARIYLADTLPRAVYLDSDVVVVDDVGQSRVVAAPEYCHANFTDAFWSDPGLVRAAARRATSTRASWWWTWRGGGSTTSARCRRSCSCWPGTSSPWTTAGTSTACAGTTRRAGAAACTPGPSASCIGAARASRGCASTRASPAPSTTSGRPTTSTGRPRPPPRSRSEEEPTTTHQPN